MQKGRDYPCPFIILGSAGLLSSVNVDEGIIAVWHFIGQGFYN